MTNEKVINKFLNKQLGHTPIRSVYGHYEKMSTLDSNVKNDTNILINYQTIIAIIKDNKLYLNTKKYSSTTSKIQSMIKRLNYKYELIEVEKEYNLIELINTNYEIRYY